MLESEVRVESNNAQMAQDQLNREGMTLLEANRKLTTAQDRAQAETSKATAAAVARAAAQNELNDARTKMATVEALLAAQELEHQQAMAGHTGVANEKNSLGNSALESQLTSVRLYVSQLTQEERACRLKVEEIA